MKTAISKNIKRFNHLTGEITAVYHTASLKAGVSDSIMQVLYTICNFGESCLLADICQLTGLRKQTVNSAIRSLEHDGFVYLIPVNPKSKMVILTEKGKLFTVRTVSKLIKAENEIFDSWSEEEVDLYLSLTERYLNSLKEKVETSL